MLTTVLPIPEILGSHALFTSSSDPESGGHLFWPPLSPFENQGNLKASQIRQGRKKNIPKGTKRRIKLSGSIKLLCVVMPVVASSTENMWVKMHFSSIFSKGKTV